MPGTQRVQTTVHPPPFCAPLSLAPPAPQWHTTAKFSTKPAPGRHCSYSPCCFVCKLAASCGSWLASGEADEIPSGQRPEAKGKAREAPALLTLHRAEGADGRALVRQARRSALTQLCLYSSRASPSHVWHSHRSPSGGSITPRAVHVHLQTPQPSKQNSAHFVQAPLGSRLQSLLPTDWRAPAGGNPGRVSDRVRGSKVPGRRGCVPSCGNCRTAGAWLLAIPACTKAV